MPIDVLKRNRAVALGKRERAVKFDYKANMKLKTSSLPALSAAVLAVVSVLFSFTACEVKKTEEGKAPTVEVEEGKMPKYDVNTADVDVNKKEKEVTVPKVTTEKKEVTVPDVDVTMPSEQPATTATPNP